MAGPAIASDEQIVAQVRSGDSAAYAAIMRRYNQRLFRAARSILRSDADAEDAVQNAYIQAYTHLEQFEGRASFSTWLTRIAIHEACALLRRCPRIETVPADANTRSAEDPERAASGNEVRRLVEQAVEALPQDYRTAFILRDVEGLSTAEAAACLDITEDNVKIRLHRARKILRDQLYDVMQPGFSRVFRFGDERCEGMVRAVISALTRHAPGQARPL